MAIDRENPRNAILTIQKAARLLQNGEVCVGVYPEGTRSKTGVLLPFHNGVFKIAQKAGVSVVVLHVSGTERIAKRTPFRATDVRIKVLDVITSQRVCGEKTDMIGAYVRRLMENETEEFQHILKEHLDEGLSYPAARAKALEIVSQISSDILSRPNHILGLEYLKALDRYNCSMEPMTIKREGDYNSPSLTDGFASAAAIRKALAEDRSTEALPQLPENVHDVYNKALSLGTAPCFWNELTPALHYKLRMSTTEEIHEIAEVVEGLENRILHSIDSCYDIKDVIDFIKTKRYTRTKIQRILLHILLDIKEKEVAYFMNLPKMPYIRVLGFKKETSGILADLTENAKVPCIQTGTGICHIYIDESADTEKALNIIENAKTSRPSVCNACEVCIIHKNVAKDFFAHPGNPENIELVDIKKGGKPKPSAL